MKSSYPITYYPKLEEKINIISHAFGLVLSVIGLIFLLHRSINYGDVNHIISFSIFGASMILLYAASTLYHNAKHPMLRYRLNILDHASIYILIAGTYTPYALITLSGTTGWIILISIWSLALIGVVLKLFYAGRYQILSTVMYVLMGWIVLFAIKPLIMNLHETGLIWLLVGGASYTIGAIIFSINRMKMNHAIFHMFVLFGTFSHFISILLYVLPVE